MQKWGPRPHPRGERSPARAGLAAERSESQIHFPSPGVFNFKAGLLWIIPGDDAALCLEWVRRALLLVEASVAAERNTSCPREKRVFHRFLDFDNITK